MKFRHHAFDHRLAGFLTPHESEEMIWIIATIPLIPAIGGLLMAVFIHEL